MKKGVVEPAWGHRRRRGAQGRGWIGGEGYGKEGEVGSVRGGSRRCEGAKGG